MSGDLRDREKTPTRPDFAVPDRIGRNATTDSMWSDFFDELVDVQVGEQRFHGYATRARANAPLMVLQHGAGSSAMSFACLAQKVRELSGGGLRILALDMRGHGLYAASTEIKYNIEALVDDLLAGIQAYCESQNLGSPETILVGHSLGGSIVARLAERRVLPRLLGVAIIDIVEGYAMDVLGHMRSYFQRRPASFASLPEAIEWHLSSGLLHREASARVSVPALLRAGSDGRYYWRTDLAATEPYWRSWFEGLSNRFLAIPAGKLLVLAGTDRLDKPLTIGQMQGKYQLHVFAETGHFVQEDIPVGLAKLLIEFWQRNQRIDIAKIRAAHVPRA